MKKLIYKIALFASTTLLYTSCDTLDLAPEDYYATGNFWKNQGQAESFVSGVYTQFRANYNTIYVLGEIRGGTLRSGTSSFETTLSNTNLVTNNIDVHNTGIGNFANLYNSDILQINIGIQQLNAADYMSDADKNRLLAELHGLRAYYYFLLYKAYGGVPLVTEPKIINEKIDINNFYIPRATPAEIMDFLKQEIGKSEQLYANSQVSSGVNKYKWSKAATLVLKAEIYMWAGKVSIEGFTATGNADLKVAKDALNQVVGKFTLMNRFADIFSHSNKANREVILALPFSDGEATNDAAKFFSADNLFFGKAYGEDGKLIENDPLNLKGRGGALRDEYKRELFESFSDKDTRRDATFYHCYNKKEALPQNLSCFMIKRIGSINSNNLRVFDSDIILYRYADVLLMMAELENSLGGSPAMYINQVRSRAYGENFAGNEYTDGSFAENELAILKERDKEFVSEGKRWYDLVRLQDANKKSLVFSAEAAYPATIPILPQEEAYKILYPVDKGTLDNNKSLEQTPGYDKK